MLPLDRAAVHEHRLRQAVGDGVFARLLAAIDNFTAVPSTFIDGGDHVVVACLGAVARPTASA